MTPIVTADAAPPLRQLDARGRGQHRADRAVIWMLGVAYIAVVLFVVFWPSPVDQAIGTDLSNTLTYLHQHGLPAFVGYQFVEFTANTALFVPLGLLLGIALPLRWWPVTVAAAPLASACIELIQSEALVQRYATVEDVVANSIGAAIGVVVGWRLRGSGWGR